MTKLKAFCRSFYKNVILKGKVRGFFILFFTKEGREHVDRLWELTKNCTRTEVQYINWMLIEPGHRIIYTEYAKGLEDHEEYLDILMIKVVKNQPYYLVVDGNHRLPALVKRAKRTNGLIKCEVMI